MRIKDQEVWIELLKNDELEDGEGLTDGLSIVQDCVRFGSNDYEKKSFTLEIPDWRVVFVNIFLPRFLVVL